jgi:hypothetical protein
MPPNAGSQNAALADLLLSFHSLVSDSATVIPQTSLRQGVGFFSAYKPQLLFVHWPAAAAYGATQLGALMTPCNSW